MNENSLVKFQDLLRTLFQFDCADLDFGIYRILNYKRKHVEAFITERLPQVVDQAFAQYAAADKAVVEQELEQKRQEIIKTLGEQAIDEDRRLRMFHDTPLGKQYLTLREKQVQYQVAEELKARVYNDLYTFFSRYYEDGDFVSKRRYGRRETYAIPYNGEEVVFYWANRDQYYIKTGEQFKAYRFKVNDYTVAFELRNIEAQQNSNAGKKRHFVLAREAPITWNEKEKALAVAFEYRALTDAEEKQHGKTEQQKPQDSLNQAAEQAIFSLVSNQQLKTILARPEKRNEREKSTLRWRLDHFTRRNTADFFIHKDLGGFLRRELDFFIKNEVLLLDELIGGKEEDLREHVQRGRVVRQVAEAIIDFLAQVEDFQKKLWEKKKFVVRTEYCLTLDRLPEELWSEVLANKAQVSEWRQLYAIKGKVNKSFLKAHPTLVVDTRHFPEDFKSHLLASFDDLDEALDGLLIKSENWQALNPLLEKYRERVKCIYIDPPFNSKSTEIIYKNTYKHSSWLSLMRNRFELATFLMRDDGVLTVAIDENEQERLGLLLEKLYPEHAKTCVTVIHNPGGIQGDNFSYCHEFAYFVYPKGGRFIGLQNREENPDIRPLRDVSFGEHLRESAANCFYPIIIKDKKVIGFGNVCDDSFHPEAANIEKDDGTIEIYPIDAQGNERKWVFSRQSVERIKDELSVEYNSRRNIWDIIRKKTRFNYKTVWSDNRYNANTYGSKLLGDILGQKVFTFPKSLYNTSDCIDAVTQWEESPIVLDFFAGSGTTAHAVIELNRHDGGARKYLLAEIDDTFETVMLPRIKKVVFCEKWKNGKPAGGNGISHFLKCQYLEQYEDTLNNLELPRAAEGQKMLDMFGDEYLLKYMLDFETQGSPCLLNLDMFKDPFAYKLKVLEGDEIVERPVDLVETFNYLLGIQVRKMQAF